MTDDEFSIKKALKSKFSGWDRIILYSIIIILALLAIFFNSIVISYQNNTIPQMCGNAQYLSSLDDYTFFCHINCAEKYGCNESYNNATYFDNDTSICYCSGIIEIDMGNIDSSTLWALNVKNISFPAGNDGKPTGYNIDYDPEEVVEVNDVN